jgi:hypothetical protein
MGSVGRQNPADWLAQDRVANLHDKQVGLEGSITPNPDSPPLPASLFFAACFLG